VSEVDRDFAKPITRVHLRFRKIFTLNHSAANTASNYFSPCYGYDVDPISGSTSMPGFAPWATMYLKSRLVRSSITLQVWNAEVASCNIVIAPYNSAPSSSYNFTTPSVDVVCAQGVAHEKLVPSLNTTPVTIRHRGTTSGFAGALSRAVDVYTAVNSGTPPANQWYWVIGGEIGASGTFSNGIQCNVVIDSIYDFFELTTPGTSDFHALHVRANQDYQLFCQRHPTSDGYVSAYRKALTELKLGAFNRDDESSSSTEDDEQPPAHIPRGKAARRRNKQSID